MVWHILKKDLKLLWPLIVGVTALQFADAAIVLKLGIFSEPRELAGSFNLFDLVCVAAAGLLIAIAVQQDPIPGAQQDWLGRPVPRRDLLLAKLLFVLIAVQVPIILSAVFVCLARGNTLGASLEASVLIGASKFITNSLPFLMIAVITRTLGQAIIGLFVLLIVIYELKFGYPLLSLQVLDTVHPPLETGGIYWIVGALDGIVIVVCALVILPLQFFWRRTFISRAIFAGGVLACTLSPFLPWKTAFAAQQLFSPDAAAGDSISIAFDRQLGRLQESEVDDFWYLPLRISGLPADAILRTDWFELRLIGADGTILYSHGDDYVGLPDFVGEPSDDSDGALSPAVRTQRGQGGSVEFHQAFEIPRELSVRIKNQRVRVEVDYSFTLLRKAAVAAIPAVSGVRKIPGLGTCASRKDERRDDDVDVYCFPSIERQECNTIFAENPSTGRRDSEDEECSGLNSAPPLLQLASLNGPGKQIDFYFFSSSGPNTSSAYVKTHPVDTSQIARSRLVITTFEPQAYFARRMTSPLIRLADLRAVIVSEPDKEVAR